MASGIFLLAVSAAAQFCLPQKSERKYPGKRQEILWSESELLSHQSSDSSEVWITKTRCIHIDVYDNNCT